MRRGKPRTVKKRERVNIETAFGAGLTVKQTMDRYGYCYALVVRVRTNQNIRQPAERLCYYEWGV